jgi:hypothetical protein
MLKFLRKAFFILFFLCVLMKMMHLFREYSGNIPCVEMGNPVQFRIESDDFFFTIGFYFFSKFGDSKTPKKTLILTNLKGKGGGREGRSGGKRETGKRRGVRSRNKRPRVGVMRRLLVGCRVQKVTGQRRC